MQGELRAQMGHEWANRGLDNEQIDNAWDVQRAWYQNETQACKDVTQQLRQAMPAPVPPGPSAPGPISPSDGYGPPSGPPAGYGPPGGPSGGYGHLGGPPGGYGPPGGPPDGFGPPGGYRHDQRARGAHKVDAPSLGSSSALPMPTARLSCKSIPVVLRCGCSA